jgi:hypothetical protein
VPALFHGEEDSAPGDVHTLDDQLAPVGLELAQHHGQGGGDDTGADEGDVDVVILGR